MSVKRLRADSCWLFFLCAKIWVVSCLSCLFQLGTPVVPFSPFYFEVSFLKLKYQETGYAYYCGVTGEPSQAATVVPYQYLLLLSVFLW